MLGRTASLYLIFMLLIALACSAENILLWNKAGPARIPNPEYIATDSDSQAACGEAGALCYYGLQKSLSENGYDSTVVEELPEDLSPYDMIFATLGFAFLEEG